MITAKQTQKFSFLNFRFSAGGVGGADKKIERKFLVFAPATEGSGRGAQIRAYDSIQSHHALRA